MSKDYDHIEEAISAILIPTGYSERAFREDNEFRRVVIIRPELIEELAKLFKKEMLKVIGEDDTWDKRPYQGNAQRKLLKSELRQKVGEL